MMKNENSITGAYLSGKIKIPVPAERRKADRMADGKRRKREQSEKHRCEVSAGCLYLCDRCVRFGKKLAGQRDPV